LSYSLATRRGPTGAVWRPSWFASAARPLLTPSRDNSARRRRLHWQLPWPPLTAFDTFAQILIREFALECGYSAAGIAERIYARSREQPMAAAAGLGS
jgi:hypothetical protein